MQDDSDNLNTFDLYRVLCLASFCYNPDRNSYCANKYPERFNEIVESMKKPQGVSTESKVFLTVLYSLITSMSLVGNSLVVITFALDKHMRSVTNVFILSLAVTDLMVTLACVPINIGSVFSVYWIFGAFACKLVPFSMTFSVACSSLTLCSIAMDRYVAIVHPYKLKFLQNPKPAAMFLVVIWMVSLLCSLPNLIFYDVKLVDTSCGKGPTKDYICVWPNNPYKLPLELWLTFIVLFIIPLVIMSVAYGTICYTLWIRKPVGQRRRNSLRNADMKKSVVKMLVIVVLAFLFCWSPIMVLNAVEKTTTAVSMSKKAIAYMKHYFQCLSLVSCCINPVIYTFMNKKFREKFAKYLLCQKNRVAPAPPSGTVAKTES